MLETPRQEVTEKPSHTSVKARLAWYRDLLLIVTIGAVVGADQLSKLIVRENLSLGESWPSEGLFRLTHGTNSGSAFGLFPSQTGLLVVASIVAIGFLVFFYRSYAMPRPLLRFAIGLQLGGAIGNLVDRLRAGAVVDFIDVGRWPIFNVADSSIVVGMSVLIGVLFLTGPGSRKGEEMSPTKSVDGQGADCD